ncbi:MAG TPA: hypothetical protein VKG79_11065, partial [Bryobacteraceae bacterium]|nr:hypothetical protein [Bryobacteraceae bacterium]
MAAALGFASLPAFAQRPCQGLANLNIAGLTINSATSVAAGSFTLPSAGPRSATVEVPGFCRVVGTI